MSTILEALRKLQAEREQPASPPKELRTSLVEHAGPSARSRSSARGMTSIWVGAACGSVVVLAAAVTMGFWPFGDPAPDPLERAMGSIPPDATRQLAALPAGRPPARDSQGAAPDPEIKRRLDQINLADPDRPAAAPSSNGEGSQLPPSGSVGSEELMQRFRDFRRNQQPIANQAPQLQGSQSAARTAPQPERPPVINFQPPAGSQQSFDQPEVPPYIPPPMRDSAAQAEQVASSRSASRSSEPRMLLSGKPQRRAPSRSKSPSSGSSPTARSSRSSGGVAATRAGIEGGSEVESAASLTFPEMRVESVRWHPDPNLRRAVVLVDGVRSEEISEGDLFEGLLIDRIDPGSVQFTLGNESTTVKLGS